VNLFSFKTQKSYWQSVQIYCQFLHRLPTILDPDCLIPEIDGTVLHL